MLAHYVLMGKPDEDEKTDYLIKDIAGIKVFVSNYWAGHKGPDKKVDLKELYWGKELYLKDA